jgi:endothelin-converting enzyme
VAFSPEQHGFDNSGRKFNGVGKLVDWWTSASTAQFSERAKCLVEQYSNFVDENGFHVNGNLTLGENIADQGGIHAAWEAYSDMKNDAANLVPLMPGLSNDQLFFVYYGQNWCGKQVSIWRTFLPASLTNLFSTSTPSLNRQTTRHSNKY